MRQKDINILHILRSIGIGGVERTTIQYCNEFVKKGLNVGILANGGLFTKSKIIHKRTKLFTFRFKISSNIFNQIRVYKSLKKIVIAEKVNIIHYHYRTFTFAIFLTKLFHRNIIIVYTHHSIFNDYFNKLIIADKTVALNKQTLNDLPFRLQKRATIIPHGIKMLDKSDTPKSKIKNVGYVGRFVKCKGLENLIDAFAKVEEKIPNARLILQGEGPLKDKIKKIIGSYNLDNKVFLKKPTISLDKIYSDIDILVLTSKRLEGFGLAILEAMARGIPAIISDLESFNELVIDGFNGIITKDNLAEDIIELLNDREKYHFLSENCIKYVSSKFKIDVTINDYIKKIYAVS